eukprot:5944214-Lingulodinium_polyedra.AAC.1
MGAISIVICAVNSRARRFRSEPARPSGPNRAVCSASPSTTSTASVCGLVSCGHMVGRRQLCSRDTNRRRYARA